MRRTLRAALAMTTLTVAAASLGAQDGAPPKTHPDDAKALATVVAIDSVQLLANDLAMKKTLSPKVLEFTKDAKEEHTENIGAVKEVAKEVNVMLPAQAPVADSLKREAEQTRQELADLQGEAFERAFVNTRIESYTKAISTIDGSLMALNVSPAVKEQLAKTRSHLAESLERARQLQAGAPR